MKLEFKVGDLLLIDLPYLHECEIEDVSQTAKAMKIDGWWHEADQILPKIRGKLGRVEYKKTLFGKKRTVIRT